jgi:hypothetical protein
MAGANVERAPDRAPAVLTVPAVPRSPGVLIMPGVPIVLIMPGVPTGPGVVPTGTVEVV